MGVNSLPKTVTRQRRDCDLNPGPSAPESSTLTTRLPSHPGMMSPCIVQSHSRRPPASNTPKYTLQLSCTRGDVFNQPFRSSTSSFLHTVTLPLSAWLSVRAPWHSSMPGSTLCMSVCPSLSLFLSLSLSLSQYSRPILYLLFIR